MGDVVAKIKGNSLTITRLIFMPASVTTSSRQVFDYTILDATTSQFVQQQTGEIRVLMKLSFESIVQIGQKLKTVKEQLGHGYFRDWLKAEFNWGAWTATKFMQVADRFAGTNYSHLDIAPSALYDLAAPSTPQAARDEVLERAAAGESISHATAKAIKQKYATPPKPKPEPISQPHPQSLLTPTTPAAPLPQSGSKLEIVAFRPQIQAPAIPEVARVIPSQTVQPLSVPQSNSPGAAPDVSGVWWQLGGRHLLYCGDPNSPEFTGRITEEVSLLFAFPSTPNWQPIMQASTHHIQKTLPKEKDIRLFGDTLESILLFCSNLGDVVVSCFLPSPEILSVISRHSRRGLFAEPDSKRVAAVISDWKKAGLKAERVSQR